MGVDTVHIWRGDTIHIGRGDTVHIWRGGHRTYMEGGDTVQELVTKSDNARTHARTHRHPALCI